VKEVKAVPVYEDDVFKYEINLLTGRKKIVEHTQEFKNIDPDKTVGAYAIVTENDGSTWVEVMTMKQIRKAWEMGNAKGNSPAHKNFADEMSCKTVVNRALKIAIGSSDDGDLFLDEEQFDDVVTSAAKHQIAEHANKKELGIDSDEAEGNVDTETGEVAEKKESSSEEKEESKQTTLAGPGF
jgi:recombination protein RecT